MNAIELGGSVADRIRKWDVINNIWREKKLDLLISCIRKIEI
jgi:hypothetical protein